MQRYTIRSPLVAIRLSPNDSGGAVLAPLPTDAIVATLGPSNLGKGMVEVLWECDRYAVFELDLSTRAVPESGEQAVGD